MGSDTVTLCQIAKIKNGKKVPTKDYDSGDIHLYGSNGIIGNISESNAPDNSIIIGRVGANAGSVMFSKRDSWVSDNAISVVPDKSQVEPYYLYYLLSSLELNKYTTGSAQPLINQNILNSFNLKLPMIDDQKAIAKFLYSLDTKIELNNQMIGTLAELASTLFKRWFVDFEFPDENGYPYKSSGGKMTESELGEIPEGWEVGKLSDIGEIIGGGTPSKKKEEYFKEGTISWITPKDLSEQKNVFISQGKTNITNLGLSKSSARLIPAKSVLFSSRAPIGYIAIASKEVSTNQGFKSVIPKEINQSEFVYLLLKNKVTDIESRATGSTFKEVSGSIMKNFSIIIPDSKIINIFSSIVKCWFRQIENLEQENDSLNDTRNILLPRLLSGEI